MKKKFQTQFVTLSLTKEVTQERKQIQNIVYNIRPALQRQLNLIDEVEQLKEVITILSEEQEDSKDFQLSLDLFCQVIHRRLEALPQYKKYSQPKIAPCLPPTPNIVPYIEPTMTSLGCIFQTGQYCAQI